MPYADPAKQREYQLKWMNERREKWLRENGPCRRCGSWDNLEVDHIDPETKLIPPSQIWSRSEKARLIELAKCQVLCKPCHQEKTSEEKSFECSDWRRFAERKGCECDACRRKHTARMQNWRQRGGR